MSAFEKMYFKYIDGIKLLMEKIVSGSVKTSLHKYMTCVTCKVSSCKNYIVSIDLDLAVQ